MAKTGRTETIKVLNYLITDGSILYVSTEHQPNHVISVFLKFQCLPRAGAHTFHAKDTFCPIRSFSGIICHINTHRTCFFTFVT